MFKKIQAKILVLVLSVTILAGVSLGSIDFDALGAPVAVTSESGLKNVTGKYDLSDVKESQYDKSVIKENISSLEGKGSVIIKVEGESLYDRYEEKSRKQDFAEFAASNAGQKYAESMTDKQNSILASMRRRGIKFEKGYNYTALTNAFSVEIEYSDIEKIEKISGVEKVYYGNSYLVPETVSVPFAEAASGGGVAMNNANVYSTGIYNTTGIEYNGSGMLVAVLDTGLDYTHQAFKTEPADTTKTYKKEDIQKKLDDAVAADATVMAVQAVPALTADDVYVNAKVPYAFDYADNDPNVYPSYSSHGTHVAGIIAGRDDSKKVGEKEDGSDETFIGVAPEAQLVIMKVFSDDLDDDNLGGAKTDAILAALNDCVILGVDVINMSLGSSAGFTSDETDEFLTEVYESIRKSGTSLIVAASNDSSSGSGGGYGMNLKTNPDSGTVGSPSTFEAALSVASIEGAEAPYFLSNKGTDNEGAAFITNSRDLYSNEYKFVDLMFEKMSKEHPETIDATTGELTLDYVVVGGVGRTSNYTSTVRRALQNGKTVALVRRGDISFSDKVRNAMDAGAVGVIIYNNLSGEIRMSLGDVENPVPSCSIDMNAGTKMVESAVRSVGTFTMKRDYTAGPFMSSFSSLGVTPDLRLKPEITAHGGEIMSAVPGGYEKMSGTSMASPNMAGAATLLRQHVKEVQHLEGMELNARVNQLLMSTATIANNPDNNPYSPRKQGAGLANILSAINTPAYITVKDTDNTVKDKTKIELLDDPNREGVYKASFTVNNLTDKAVEYTLSSYVMTETLAINNKTVEENSKMLDDADVTFTVNNAQCKAGSRVTVPANGALDISVTVTLTQANKEYIDTSFENGMYVEGFFRLLKGDGADAAYSDLSVPFLAFYGDWADAPLLDYSLYELAVTDADQSIKDEDKPKAQSRATTPIGLYDNGQYILQLGSYIYAQDEMNVEIFPDEKKAALSMYDEAGHRSIYELYMIYGGLLRCAKTMHVTIADAATGELIYDKVENNVRKAYAGGGSNVGAPILMDMNPSDWGLANNREYVFKMQGTLDWEKNGGKANNDTFRFTFRTDYEAPTIEAYSVRFEPYTENKEVKYKIYLDVDVHDNQYAAAVLPCYIKDNTLTLMTEYVVPVYSSQNSTTRVSIDITDYYDAYINNNTEYSDGGLFLGVEDYAMNQSLWEIDLKKAVKYCDSLEFAEDGDKLILVDEKTEDTTVNGQPVKNKYNIYDLTIAPNEAYKLNAATTPSDTFPYKMEWSVVPSRVASANENEIFGKSAGNATVTVKDGNGLVKARINVTVTGSALREPAPEKLTALPMINKDDHVQSLATQNGVAASIELYPFVTRQLSMDVQPWYAKDKVEFEYSSSNPAVASVSDSGLISTHSRGTATVTISAKGYNRVSTSVRIVVVSEYNISNYTLYDYYGPSDVKIPDELNVMYIDEDCFAGKPITSIVLPKTLTEIRDNTFLNCTSLKTVTIPGKTTVLGKSAFENCTALETLILQEFIDDDFKNDPMTGVLTAGNRAFANCRSLKTIYNPTRLTAVGREAFLNCTSLETLNLTKVAFVYDRAFAGCTSLKSVELDGFTEAGTNMFYGCTSLNNVVYKMDTVAQNMFYGCTSLDNITFEVPLRSIGASAFEGTALKKVSLKGNVSIDTMAFANTPLTQVELGADCKINIVGYAPFAGCDSFTQFALASGNTYYQVDSGILYDSGKTRIILVPDGITSVPSMPSTLKEIGNSAFANRKNLTSFTIGSSVTSIGDNAFAGTALTSIVIPASVKEIGYGAFANCASLSSVTLGSGVTEIQRSTFGGCSALSDIDLSNIVYIGANAFAESGLTSVTFGSGLKEISDGAFMSTSLVNVVLPAGVKTIGKQAFASMPELTTVTLSSVTAMGDYAFAGNKKLSGVTVADGATVIGDFAFYGSSALTSLILPDSIKSIGTGAFYGSTELKSVNLGNVENIGNLAFYGCGLTSLTTAAVTVGDGAFANTALTNADISKAESVGVQAFLNAPLTNVRLDSVKTLGSEAFAGTRLVSVKLPATLSSYNKEKVITVHRQSNDMIEDIMFYTESVGGGVFAAVPTLVEIKVDSANPVFFDDNGILYGRVNDGYTLVQYPAGKSGTSYEVKADTVRIEPEAFFFGITAANAKLKKVTLPASLKNIGDRAFYASGITEYVFNSVAAPVLESNYVSEDEVSEDSALSAAFAARGNNSGSEVFYANFSDYVARITAANKIKEAVSGYKAPDFGLTATYPENGVGYDNMIWSAFFSSKKTSAYAADANTLAAIKALGNLPDVSEINSAADITALDALASEKVVPARALYNEVTDPAQLAFISEADIAKLPQIEAAVRAAREKFGAPAHVASLKIASRPQKLRYYDGDTLDTTGLSVVAVYDDTSEEIITGYTLDKSVLHIGDNLVTVSYEGKEASFNISVSAVPVYYTVKFSGKGVNIAPVTVQSGEKLTRPEDPVRKGYEFVGWYNGDEQFDFLTSTVNSDLTLTARFERIGGGLSAGAIAGIVIGCVLVAAGIATAVVFILLKKKGKTAKGE